MGRWGVRLLLPTLLLALAPPAFGQSMNDLRRENERLRQRVEELEAQLEQARSIIERLERTTAQLRREVERSNGEDGSDGAGEPRKTAPVPEDPYAAPEAMYQHLIDRYYEEFGEEEEAEAPDPAESPERAARRWARIVSQKMREPVEWTVRILELSDQENQRGRTARIDVIDRESGLPIGESFEVTLRSREVLRVEDRPLQELWVLDGIFGASPRVLDDEETSKLFGAPRLIGPRIAFDWEFSVRSIRPVEEPEGEEKAPAS